MATQIENNSKELITEMENIVVALFVLTYLRMAAGLFAPAVLRGLTQLPGL